MRDARAEVRVFDEAGHTFPALMQARLLSLPVLATKLRSRQRKKISPQRVGRALQLPLHGGVLTLPDGQRLG